MLCIIGLGNPGQEYFKTRHNIGFSTLDLIVQRFSLPDFKINKKFRAEISVGEIGGRKIILCKPQTYMNLSGEAAILLRQYYKIPNDNVLVFHDDLDLESGVIKIKKGGGSGGNNGLKSLDQHLGNDYWRIRIGIGRPEFKGDVSNYVLGKFSSSEQEVIDQSLNGIVDNFDLLLEKDFPRFLNDLKRYTRPQIK